MKLPEDKKERVKILFLIGFGTVGVLYMVISLGIKPLLKSKQTDKAEIERLTAEKKTSEGIIKGMAADKKENFETLRQIKDISDKPYLIHPLLGENYKLVVQRIVARRARNVELKPEPIREVGDKTIAKYGADIKAWTASVSLVCGYNDAIRFMREFEENNPFLCITTIEILAQPDPEKHRVTFRAQWPIWANRRMPAWLNKELAEQKK